ncbi:hypothetical protein Skr01_37780 [Sphaerisporangium krabiense]|nr:hypothetical protein Skr01_37780 [Sphaerisporangium krabiense]
MIGRLVEIDIEAAPQGRGPITPPVTQRGMTPVTPRARLRVQPKKVGKDL